MIDERVINIDKAAGISSARVVGMVKRMLPRGTKVGHAGTLDPFATGVLLVLVGKATKRCEELMNGGKVYETTIKLGASTETLDPESQEIPRNVEKIPTREEVERVVAGMKGLVWQTPPIFSAMKVGGQRAYKLARAGKAVELAPRQVRIDAMEVLRYAWPEVDLRIECGRGTYVRAIARDLGEALGVGGYLLTLRRMRVGDFDVRDAVKVEGLKV